MTSSRAMALEEMFCATLKDAMQSPNEEAMRGYLAGLSTSKLRSLTTALEKGLLEARGFCEAEYGSLCEELDLTAKLEELHRAHDIADAPDLTEELRSVTHPVDVEKEAVLLKHKEALVTIAAEKRGRAEALEAEVFAQEQSLRSLPDVFARLKEILGHVHH